MSVCVSFGRYPRRATIDGSGGVRVRVFGDGPYVPKLAIQYKINDPRFGRPRIATARSHTLTGEFLLWPETLLFHYVCVCVGRRLGRVFVSAATSRV